MNITPEQIIKASQIGAAILSRPDVPIPALFRVSTTYRYKIQQ